MLSYINCDHLLPIVASALFGAFVGYCTRATISRLSSSSSAASRNLLAMANVYDNDTASGSAYKMVLVVRNDLKMGKGKACAQCSHAAVSFSFHPLFSFSRFLS